MCYEREEIKQKDEKAEEKKGFFFGFAKKEKVEVKKREE